MNAFVGQFVVRFLGNRKSKSYSGGESMAKKFLKLALVSFFAPVTGATSSFACNLSPSQIYSEGVRIQSDLATIRDIADQGQTVNPSTLENIGDRIQMFGQCTRENRSYGKVHL